MSSFGISDPYVYHGTIRARLQGIRAHGLLASKDGMEGPGIYLSQTIENARGWAKEHTWDGSDIVILRIPKDKLVDIFGIWKENKKDNGIQFDMTDMDVLIGGVRENIPANLIEYQDGSKWVGLSRSSRTARISRRAKFKNSQSMTCPECESPLRMGDKPLIEETKVYSVGLIYECRCKKSRVWTNRLRNPKAFVQDPAEYYQGVCNDLLCGHCFKSMIPVYNGYRNLDLWACENPSCTGKSSTDSSVYQDLLSVSYYVQKYGTHLPFGNFMLNDYSYEYNKDSSPPEILATYSDMIQKNGPSVVGVEQTTTAHIASSWGGFIHGEYWIVDGHSTSCDADVDDYTHESFAEEQIANLHCHDFYEALLEAMGMTPDHKVLPVDADSDAAVNREEYPKTFKTLNNVTHELSDDALIEIWLSDQFPEEILQNIVPDYDLFRRDIRQYFEKHFNAIRAINNNFAVWKLDKNLISDIQDFLYEVLDVENGDMSSKDLIIEEDSNQRYVSMSIEDFLKLDRPSQIRWSTTVV